MKCQGKKTVLHILNEWREQIPLRGIFSHGPFYPNIAGSASTHTSTGNWATLTSSHQITINFDLLDPDAEISKLFAMDESDAEKPSTKHKCTCDYDTVIKIRGCQCGGV